MAVTFILGAVWSVCNAIFTSPAMSANVVSVFVNLGITAKMLISGLILWTVILAWQDTNSSKLLLLKLYVIIFGFWAIYAQSFLPMAQVQSYSIGNPMYTIDWNINFSMVILQIYSLVSVLFAIGVVSKLSAVHVNSSFLGAKQLLIITLTLGALAVLFDFTNILFGNKKWYAITDIVFLVPLFGMAYALFGLRMNDNALVNGERTILDKIPDGIVITDLTGNIKKYNQQFQHLTALTTTKLNSTNIKELLVDQDNEKPTMGELLVGNTNNELYLQQPSGVNSPVLLSISIFHEFLAVKKGYIIVLTTLEGMREKENAMDKIHRLPTKAIGIKTIEMVRKNNRLAYERAQRLNSRVRKLGYSETGM
jgi:PAS domain S-box-containing protein